MELATDVSVDRNHHNHFHQLLHIYGITGEYPYEVTAIYLLTTVVRPEWDEPYYTIRRNIMFEHLIREAGGPETDVGIYCA